MQFKKVFSSHVNEIGYADATAELHVRYKNGKEVVYIDVPPDVGYQAVNAVSVGEYLHDFVRNKYEFKYVGMVDSGLKSSLKPKLRPGKAVR